MVFSVSAATELTPGQAAAVKPFDRIVVTGRFNAIGEAVKAVSRRVDKEGAASFYVVNTSDSGNSGNWRVVVNLYRADVEKIEETGNRVINSVVELPKDRAVLVKSFDTVVVRGLYHSQPEINDVITKAAKAKGTYSFYIVRRIDANQGGNQRVTTFIYKRNAKKHTVRSPDAIPVDSEAGRATLAAGDEATKKVEVPGVATTASPNSEVDHFFKTQSSKSGCYTVTPPDGTKVEELNEATVATVVPFDSIKFPGDYGNMTKVSYQAVKRAVKRGAKHYYITRQ